MSGSSCAAHAIWARATNGLSGLTTAASAGRSSSSVGMARVPLVELVVAGDEHRRGAPAWCARPGPTCWRIDASVPGKPLSTTASSEPTSMPSSSALVATTPPSSPLVELRLELAPLGRRGSRRGTPRRRRRERRRALASSAAGVGGDELGALAAAGERERLVAVGDEAREQHRGLDVRRRARAGVDVDERSLPHREAALGLR